MSAKTLWAATVAALTLTGSAVAQQENQKDTWVPVSGTSIMRMDVTEGPQVELDCATGIARYTENGKRHKVKLKKHPRIGPIEQQVCRDNGMTNVFRMPGEPKPPTL